MRLTLPLIAATALTAAPALAQDFYVSGFGGFSSLNDPTFSGVITPPGGQQTIGSDFDGGYGLGVAVGTSIPSLSYGNLKLRGELELSYTDSDVNGLTFSGNGPGAENNVAGDIRSTRVFANLIADVETASAFTPYFGAGLGLSSNDLSLSYGGAPGAVNLDERSTNFSAQAILGASYALNDSTSLFSDIRYIRDFGVSSVRTSPAGFTGVVEDDIDTVNVNFGVRFKF